MTLATLRVGLTRSWNKEMLEKNNVLMAILTLTSPIDINVHWFLKQNILLFPCYKFE